MHFKKLSSHSNNFSARVISTFASKIANLTLITIANIIIARQLGPAGKGMVSIAILVPSLLATIGHLGIGSANIYYGSKDTRLIKKLFGNSLIYGVILSAIVATFYFSSTPLLERLLDKELRNQYLIICFWLFPLNLVWGYIGSIMQARQKIHELAIGRVLHNVIYLLIVVVTVALFKYGVAAILSAMILAYVTEMMWDHHFIKKDVSLKIHNDLSLLKKQIAFGIKSYIGNLLDFVNNRFDMFLVNYFLNIGQVGIYSISVILAELVFYIPSATSTVLFPVTAALGKDHANKFTPEVCRHTFLWSVTLAIILALIAKPVIEILFTANFVNSVVPLWFLLPGVVALSVQKVISTDIIGRGKPVLSTYSAGTAAICTIILDFILIPLWGVPGAALASSLAYFISTILIIYFFIKESGSNVTDLFIPTRGDLKYYGVCAKAAFKTIMYK
jgi:O-antigen/teichoic acid export membrane protein